MIKLVVVEMQVAVGSSLGSRVLCRGYVQGLSKVVAKRAIGRKVCRKKLGDRFGLTIEEV